MFSFDHKDFPLTIDFESLDEFGGYVVITGFRIKINYFPEKEDIYQFLFIERYIKYTDTHTEYIEKQIKKFEHYKLPKLLDIMYHLGEGKTKILKNGIKINGIELEKIAPHLL